ncbi:hypothetical protein PanWU01x14_289830 [Parasponia andersonii]|uniref:Uncharacterized protein n=1 Tax=Parasponia andersonii TaxID=3476 RepID=A0A2P5AXX4_PARAD|nr:hypothetical protein PanWU01x14_289830 [Parasponia andersonii]
MERVLGYRAGHAKGIGQIMERVLGYQAGHAKGIGPLLKGTSKKQRDYSSFTSTTSSSRPPQHPMVEPLPHIDIPPPPTLPPGFDEPTPPEPRMEDDRD